jgi:hypothetical protein
MVKVSMRQKDSFDLCRSKCEWGLIEFLKGAGTLEQTAINEEVVVPADQFVAGAGDGPRGSVDGNRWHRHSNNLS